MDLYNILKDVYKRQVTYNNDESIVKFEVASLDDDIKVSTYVVPMERNVEFGVALKNDTLTLVDTIVSGCLLYTSRCV